MSSSRMYLLALLAVPVQTCHQWSCGDTTCENCYETLLEPTDYGIASFTAENCVSYVTGNFPAAIGATVDFVAPGSDSSCWAEFRGSGSDPKDDPIYYSYGSDSEYKTCWFVLPAGSPAGTPASSCGDPHMSDGRGGRFDFKGKDMVVYNLLTTANMTVNALFKHTDYNDAGPKRRLIHGSFMTAAYVTTKASNGRILQIEYDATRAVFLNVKLDGAEPTRYQAPASISLGNVSISLKDRKMTIITSDWAVKASSKMKKGIIRGNSCATGKCFLNVEIKPLTDVGHGNVAPHGLIGQAFDGGDVSVVGATDKYKGVEYTTSAMGEGAIEGTATDYEMADKFSSSFKFSRWGLEVAKPRNVSTLTGLKVKRAQMTQGTVSASAADDVYDEQTE